MKKSTRIFFLLSLLFVSLDGIFILINYYSAQSAMEKQLADVGREVEAAFVQAQQATEQRMLQIATFVAADREVQQLFLAGRKAVDKEGGNRGGPLAAKVRRRLYDRVAASRDALAAQYDFRQLQFHLGPGSLSFLRVHEPSRFGDNMDTVRHTVVTVNRTHRPVSGFETGRVYSGIRGVVPVSAVDPEIGKRVYVGALEAGTSYQDTLENASLPRRVGMAVLLKVEHLKNHVWPDFLAQFLQKNPPVDGLALEGTTSPEISVLLNNRLLPPPAVKEQQRRVMELEGVQHLVIRFPLYDFAGLQDLSLPPVGSVVAWKNMDQVVRHFESSLKTNIVYALFGFLVTELLLYFALLLGTRRLESIVEQGRRDLSRSLEQLRRSEEKFLTMAEFSVDWETWQDADGQYLYITPSCEDVSGYPRERFYEDPDFFHTIIHFPDNNIFLEHRHRYFEDHSDAAEVTFRIVRKDGAVRWIWHKCQSVFSRDGEWLGRRSTNRDITKMKEVEEELRRLSFTDVLTGAYNRRMFMDQLAREIKRTARYGESFSLLIFDLDHFKEINDTYGHDVGDRVLIEVVRLTRRTVRQSDVVARWGGEEFMVLLPATPLNEAVGLAERLRRCMAEQTFAEADGQTVSVGVVHVEPEESMESVLKRVQMALAKAQEVGGDSVTAG